MKHLIALIAITILFISSCKKNEIETPQPTTPNYMPLSIGNYWVYENVRLDSYGNDSIVESRDSLYILKDTIINDNIYFVIEGSYRLGGQNTLRIQRDSSGYLVNHLGEIQFSSTNFQDTLNTEWVIFNQDTMAVKYSKMIENIHVINLQLGIYNALDFQSTYIQIANPNIPTEYLHKYYSKDIGLILEPWHYYSTYYEIRLVSYHIEK